jgi:hypothetical protein
VPLSIMLLLLLPSSTMASEDEGQRTELTPEERERRATIPLLRRLVSERHHQQHQRCEASARVQQLRQEVDKLDVYNMDCLHVESEALDLRVSSSLLLPKTAPPAGPPPVRVLLEARQTQPVRDHLDSLIVPMTTGVDVPLGLMINPVESHLNSLVRVEAGAQLPPFCLVTLVTQLLPPMSLEGVRVVAGSVIPSSTRRPSAQPGTKRSPISAVRLREIQEGILQHNLKCRDVQEHLNRERQWLHRAAVRYGLSTNLWTAIVLMIPVLLLEAGQAGGFLVYDCSHNQLKTQTIDLTAPKDCKDPTMDYYPVRMTQIKIIMTDGDRPIIATQCLVLKPKRLSAVEVIRVFTTDWSRLQSTSPWRSPLKSAGTPSLPARSLYKGRGWTSRSG